MERRNTIQRELVLAAVRSLKCHATADEVYEVVRKEHPNISRATVYRNLNLLADEQQIKKVITPTGAERFDHRVDRHYHVKCIKCGRLFDVDMDEIEDMNQKIIDAHHVKILGYDILFSGICQDCQKQGEN